MKEKDPATAYILGMYYDRERLYLSSAARDFFSGMTRLRTRKEKTAKLAISPFICRTLIPISLPSMTFATESIAPLRLTAAIAPTRS